MKELNRFGSRKFLVAVATIILISFPALGVVEDALIALFSTAYILVQGVIDGMQARRGGQGDA